MKKVLTIIAITFILLSVSIISNAAVKITEDKLEEVFKKLMEDSEDSENYSFNKEKDLIVMKAEENIHELYYDLEDKPKFYTEITLEKSMTKEKADEELSKTILPFVGFVLTSNVVEINYEDSIMYSFSKYMELAIKYDNNENIEYTNGIEYAKKFYPDKTNSIINDKLFDLTVNKQQETETEYILRAELTVNIEEDFSTLKGYAEENAEEGFGQLVGLLGDAFNELNLTDVNKEDSKETSVIDKNNTVANIEKIPQTGNEISLKSILYLVIGVASLMGISLTIYNKKTVK